MADKRVAILFSGRGSNMIALLRAMESPDFGGKPVLLLSDRPQAEGLEITKDLGLTPHILDSTRYRYRSYFDRRLNSILMRHNIDIICLAGFMRILGAKFTNDWDGRILNIHPSFLPNHRGLNTHKRAILAGDSYAGATVHLVNKDLDSGKILDQVRVYIQSNDTADSLSKRVLHEEHRLYPLVLHDFLKGKFGG